MVHFIKEGIFVSQTNQRIPWIDELRGLAVWAMIAYHIAFNLIYFLGLDLPWLVAMMESPVLGVLHTAFVAVFLGLSGICCHFTRHPLKRAGRVFMGAMAVTLVTLLVYPDEAIWFGMLHCLAVLMALHALFKRMADRVPLKWGLLISALLFILSFKIPEGKLLWWNLPEILYQCGILMPIGFPSPSFESLDYVPLLPHLFLFSAGVFLGNQALPAGKMHSRFLAFCGRHSLFIYLAHQPIVFGIFLLLTEIL